MKKELLIVEQVERLPLLGGGSRRECFAFSDSLCVKFYRRLDDTRIKPFGRVWRDIAIGRFLRMRNINCKEARFREKLVGRVPEALLAVFPEVMEVCYSPERGYGVVESLIRNSDGSEACEVGLFNQCSWRLLEAVKELCGLLEVYAVPFFDTRNILIQWLPNGDFRLRIADIEPTVRALIPGLSHCDWFVRLKLKRRNKAFLERLRRHCVLND